MTTTATAAAIKILATSLCAVLLNQVTYTNSVSYFIL